MTEICIIRHGETDWNAQFKIQGRSDIPLNEIGRRQASVTAEYLEEECWDIIYSSPLKRALETARTISKAVRVPAITIESDLIECDFGDAEGMAIDERKLVYPDRNLIPGAEKLDDIKFRAEKIITAISERHKGKRIIIVSHACFIMEVLGVFSDGKINGRKTPLKNLSMTLLTRDEDWNIPWYNRSALERELAATSQ
ncbi:MAG: histidine phosphatase family protein [Spirochaetales bacterium]|nr:histidine phosphatase family protein [Spirochaetales bacterium]